MRIPIVGGSLILVGVALFLTALSTAGPRPNDHVSVVVHEPERRVDISIDGKPFTSYIWPTTLKKPVLYPLRTAEGTVITRGYPLEHRAGERIDHPHHAGLWFNYENVNGIDFWNNSDAIPAARAPKMERSFNGPYFPRKVVNTKASWMSRPIGLRLRKKSCLRSIRISCFAAGRASGASTALRL